MRIIEIITDQGHSDTLQGIAEHHDVIDIWQGEVNEDERRSTRMLVAPDQQQVVMDVILNVIGKADNTHIMLLPVEAIYPRPEEDKIIDKQKSMSRSREELYQNISSGSKLDSNFILMVVMSTIVAAIGLIENNIAVVIGAMVIAPLLGPNMALAFASTLGEVRLLVESLKANLSGLLIALLMTFIIGKFWPVNLTSYELISRTDVGLDGIMLALVSGSAAALSLTTGLSSSLVGVMVAVALLPPAATLGLMLGAGNYQSALGAGLLLAVNIVCVNLAANITFLFRGIKPRTWFEKQKAKQSFLLFILFWLLALTILVTILKLRQEYLTG